MIGRLAYWISRLFLTLVDQVRNDFLSQVSGIRVPAEFGAAEVPRRKMVEVGSTSLFHRASFSEAIRL
jgi:hypothetical protein